MSEEIEEEIEQPYVCYCHQTWLEKMDAMYSNFIPIDEKQKLKMIYAETYYPWLKTLVKRTSDICWLTIRPKNCDELTFKHFIEKFVNTPTIKEYYYGYEWKPNDASSGLHCHLILKGQKSRINEKINRKSKATPCKKIGKMKFHKKWIKSHLIQDKIDYINGKTHDVDKNEQKKINEPLRQKHNMPNVSTLK